MVQWSAVPGSPAVLGEELAAQTLQPTRRAVQHVHRAGILDGTDPLKGHPDGQIGSAIIVEVSLQARGRRGLDRGHALTGRPDAGGRGEDQDNHDSARLHHLLPSRSQHDPPDEPRPRVGVARPWKARMREGDKKVAGDIVGFGDVGRNQRRMSIVAAPP